MLDDQRATKRVTERPQTGSCLHCHASSTVLYREVGLAKGAPGSLAAPFGSPEAQTQLMTGFKAGIRKSLRMSPTCSCSFCMALMGFWTVPKQHSVAR